MKLTRFFFSVLTMFLMVTSCSRATETESTTSTSPASDSPAAPAPADPSGQWAGNWGPSERDRNDVVLELKFEGGALSGVVNPGPMAIMLSKASYDPATGSIMMEADAQGRGGTPVHYVIDGKVAGGTMSGTWSHDDRKGDFTLTKH